MKSKSSSKSSVSLPLDDKTSFYLGILAGRHEIMDDVLSWVTANTHNVFALWVVENPEAADAALKKGDLKNTVQEWVESNPEKAVKLWMEHNPEKVVKAFSKDNILSWVNAHAHQAFVLWAIENPKEFKSDWDKGTLKKTAQKWMKANPEKAMKVWLGYNRQEVLEHLTKKGGKK